MAESEAQNLLTAPAVMASRARARSVLSVSYLVTAIILLTFNFLLPRAMPGDPISALLASAESKTLADLETRASLERYYGLDRPLADQYVAYLGGVVRGDFGVSIRFRASVVSVLAERLPWTLLLGISALGVATVIGTVAGIHAGWRHDRQIDRGMTAAFMSVRVFPTFVLASLMLYGLSVKLGWLPLGGAETPFSPYTGPSRAADIARHLVLPASVLAIQMAAFQYLLMRSSMVAEAGSDYLLLGRAKGLAEKALKYRHAARNALLPAVTHTGAQLASALTGTIFVETVFAYPGIGRLMFDAVASRDYPVLQACFLVFTLGVLIINFATDMVYPRLDPRTATA